MRALFLPVAALVALAATFDARAAGGAYASSAARDAAACARLCADDGLCIAWSFGADGVCHLRATAPGADAGVAQGFSPRAPQALRAPLIQERAAAALAATDAAAGASAETEGSPAHTEDALDELLLGGLENDDTGLRN